jgi:hypothetical protein
MDVFAGDFDVHRSIVAPPAAARWRSGMHRMLRRTGLVACALLCGCTYLQNRANDLLDPFRFDVGFTPGLHVDARATDFAALGVGVKGGVIVGLHGRFAVRYRTASVGIGPLMLGEVFRLEASPLIGESKYDADHDMVPSQIAVVLPRMGVERPRPWSLERRGLHVADIGVNVAAVVGAGVGFSPGEFVDLLLGFVAIDMAGDDVAGRAEAQQQDPATTTEPR